MTDSVILLQTNTHSADEVKISGAVASHDTETHLHNRSGKTYIRNHFM